ncbi:MAG: HipA domain-containing protein [Clostridiales Family XIII bacterium]|jgi:serine/threonine-protein kinase HipA|nr:HipA domain-containing protein [Clostridiales Family XIII bacterium]
MADFHVYDFENEYVGKCYYTHKRGRLSSMFSYSLDYLSQSGIYNVDPAFQMIEGSQFVDSPIPRAFTDSAPDRWGRNLIYKRHLYEAQVNGVSAKELNDVDYLLGVSDLARQGSLRFKIDKGGAYVHESSEIPKLIALPKLLNSTNALEASGSHEAIKYLLDVGSASLGGARPKATVRDDNGLFLAKFPHIHDEWDVISWEYVALSIAKSAGIDVPDFELVEVDGSKVLLLRRFDRLSNASNAGEISRVGYMSAMTLLGAEDGQKADYADICLHMADVSVDFSRDLSELYRRIILSILINNTDDHLRNHGFLRDGSGWRLSPVFDINPNPERGEARATSIYGQTDRVVALEALRINCSDFKLNEGEAASILKEIREVVKSWRDIAKRAGIHQREIELMETAFAQ